jgi:hypothetical protein
MRKCPDHVPGLIPLLDVSIEEDESPQLSLLSKAVGDGSREGALARPSKTIKPEDSFEPGIYPAFDEFKDVFTSTLEALCSSSIHASRIEASQGLLNGCF